MPLQTCTSDGKPAYRWGEHGKAYTYNPNDEASRKEAKRKAIIQGVAIEGGSVEGMIGKEREDINIEFVVKDYNDEDNCIFGWAYVAKDEHGNQMYDHSGEFVDDIHDLEIASYVFNLAFRESGFYHVGKAKGYLIEGMAFTREKMKKMGIPEGTLPEGIWAGFFFPDDEDYALIKEMENPMFSIQGTAIKEEV
jgi:hypothetical protein